MTAPGIRLAGDFFFGGTALFESIGIDVAAGAWTCLLGPSGVGKSTVLRLIAGLDTGGDFEGRIEASDGAPLDDRIAYMAQSDLLAPWLDVRENVVLGARLRRETPDFSRAKDLIERVGLGEHVHKKPPALSGGMRQRVALARLLMEDRPIALLDEPFAALDVRTRAEMQELTFACLEGRTVLLVTHDPLETARLGSCILLMSEAGMSHLAPPPTPPIRPVEAIETLRAQARFTQAMRGEAA